MTEVPRLSRRDFAIMLSLFMATAIGNTGLLSVLPTIGRSIGIADPMVAAIFSLSSLLWAVTSPFWARQSDVHGRKPIMMIGLAGFAFSMMLCGLVVSIGLAHLAPPIVVFWAFLFCRSIFGLFGSGISPATQAYVAERTAPHERTRWMSAIAGASSLGTVVGPVVAPMFIVGALGFAGPLYAFTLIAIAMWVIVARFMKGGTRQALAAAPRSDGTVPIPLWRRRSFRPFIIYGFLVFVCQNAQAQTLGFLIIDRTHRAFPALPSRALLHVAQGYIEIAMMAGATTSLLALWGITAFFRLTPKTLLRWGAGLAALGSMVIVISPGYATAIIGYALSSLGFALARPGFTAGASLSVGLEDQAAAAGVIGGISGANVLLTPFAVMFYGVYHPGPFLLEGTILAWLLVYACRNPILRTVGGGLTHEREAQLAESTFQESDECKCA